jgi:hypothetical protein
MSHDWSEGIDKVPDLVLNPVPAPASLLNNIQGRVWNLYEAIQNTPVKSGTVWVLGFAFEGYVSTSSRCMLKDGEGAIVFETTGNADLLPVEKSFSEPTPIVDLELSELTDGRVLVYVG